MKGTFAVEKVEDLGSEGVALLGKVTSGQLIEGMEGRYNSTIIIINGLLGSTKKMPPKESAKKGQKVRILPKATVFELLQQLEGEKIDFEDVRLLPVKESLILEPEPI